MKRQPLPDKTLLLTRHTTSRTHGHPITLYYYTDGTYHGDTWKPASISLWKIIDDIFYYKHQGQVDFTTDEEDYCMRIAKELQLAMAEREWLHE